MLFMNEHEVADARDRFANHALLGPATETLSNLVEATNRCSDGWAYWSAPVKAAKQLQALVKLASAVGYADTPQGRAALKRAYTPLKSLRTRYTDQGLTFEIVEPRT